MPFATAWNEIAARLLERLCRIGPDLVDALESKRSSGP